MAVTSKDEEGMVASHRFPTFRHDAESVDLDYLLAFFQSDHGRALLALNSPGAAGRNRTLRIGALLNEKIPLPPLEEQRQLVKELREGERRIDDLRAAAEEGISLLREYRSALISAAVTGKIDVREEAA